jgi:hypothetical protein
LIDSKRRGWEVVRSGCRIYINGFPSCAGELPARGEDTYILAGLPASVASIMLANCVCPNRSLKNIYSRVREFKTVFEMTRPAIKY